MELLRKRIERITPVSGEEFDYIPTFFATKHVEKVNASSITLTINLIYGNC
ncbi:MAG: hypothetical protein ACO1N0_05270 [Fluviicola sp.]